MKKIMFNEVWKDIEGFEGLYEVSNHGNVRRSDTKVQKKASLNRYGYPQVNLYKNNKSHLKRVHRLVAVAFVENHNPEKYDCINHKDENPCNNYFENLEWCDRKYNNNYGSHNAKCSISHSIPIEQYTLDGQFIKEWSSATSASRELGIPQMAINSCCLRKKKYNQAGGFLWKFKNDENPVTYKHGKNVEKFSLDGELLETYENITIAAKENCILITSISQCINGHYKTAGGFIWKLKK
ncbi:MAG: HNH endonuclease [Bacteroidales bacterium]|nr:HNH endonuclease [Bacteroidales bacterium]